MKHTRTIGRVLLWVLTVPAAAAIVLAGLAKFDASSDWPRLFAEVWGYPDWFRSFTGAVEVGGGVLLLIPRTAPYAAAGLIVVMLGAAWTVATRGSDLGLAAPIIWITVYSIILAARWPLRKESTS